MRKSTTPLRTGLKTTEWAMVTYGQSNRQPRRPTCSSIVDQLSNVLAIVMWNRGRESCTTVVAGCGRTTPTFGRRVLGYHRSVAWVADRRTAQYQKQGGRAAKEDLT